MNTSLVVGSPATNGRATSSRATSSPLPSTLIAEVRACQGCGACLLTCPEHAIRPFGGTLAVLADRCSGCGECVEVCPVDAIVMLDREGGDVR